MYFIIYELAHKRNGTALLNLCKSSGLKIGKKKPLREGPNEGLFDDLSIPFLTPISKW
jgi:hypothetical protein